MNQQLLPTGTLEKIRRQRIDSVNTQPLSHSRYDQSHELFERSSDQQSQILRWLVDFSNNHFRQAESLRVMSVGCGSGILDLPLIESISERIDQLLYVGIDPNQVACKRFREAFCSLGLPDVELRLHEMSINSLDCEIRYDFILAIHSLYYFSDPASDIEELMRRLKSDGKLVILQAPKAELNQLADCFWSEHTERDIWFSRELESYLSKRGLTFRKQRIDASVDVSNCFEVDNHHGEMILDFILQTRSRELNQKVVDLCLDFLERVSDENQGRVAAPHPVDVFVVEKKSGQP